MNSGVYFCSCFDPDQRSWNRWRLTHFAYGGQSQPRSVFGLESKGTPDHLKIKLQGAIHHFACASAIIIGCNFWQTEIDSRWLEMRVDRSGKIVLNRIIDQIDVGEEEVVCGRTKRNI